MLYIFLHFLDSLRRSYDYFIEFLMSLLFLSSLISKFLSSFLITILNPIELFLPNLIRTFITPIINPLWYNLRISHLTWFLFDVIITITMWTICCPRSRRGSLIMEDIFVCVFSCFQCSLDLFCLHERVCAGNVLFFVFYYFAKFLCVGKWRHRTTEVRLYIAWNRIFHHKGMIQEFLYL